MEWVEVRGETLEAAKEEALDQLGVDRDDAEFEVVQEPESRWLGFKKTEARVRARVRPTQARPKKEARSRRQRGQRGGGQGGRGGGRREGGGARTDEPRRAGGGDARRREGRGPGERGRRGQRQEAGGSKQGGRDKGGGRSRQAEREDETPTRTSERGGGKARDDRSDTGEKGAAVSEDSRRGELVPMDDQRVMVTEFLEGLVAGFGVDATVSTSVEDDTLIGSIDGTDLGLLIGPKGGTMHAIQELSRSAVQRKADGRDTNRLLVDVAGYRERRRAALAEFARRQAEQVKATGTELALEPMSSADRKAIHDAVMEIDGVKSMSEGDEPRWVVLVPDEG